MEETFQSNTLDWSSLVKLYNHCDKTFHPIVVQGKNVGQRFTLLKGMESIFV